MFISSSRTAILPVTRRGSGVPPGRQPGTGEGAQETGPKQMKPTLLECGGKRSATPLLLGAERPPRDCPTMQPDQSMLEIESVPPEAKARSPLRSAGALHKTPWPSPHPTAAGRVKRPMNTPPNSIIVSSALAPFSPPSLDEKDRWTAPAASWQCVSGASSPG
jgi:hypothetical protein